jgi:hypothetical protein
VADLYSIAEGNYLYLIVFIRAISVIRGQPQNKKAPDKNQRALCYHPSLLLRPISRLIFLIQAGNSLKDEK